MSIINQALQKAQREQRTQRPHDLQYVLAGQQRRSTRQQWRRRLLGLSLVLGIGWLAYGWRTAELPRLAVLPEPVQMPLAGPAQHETPSPEPVAPAPVGWTDVAVSAPHREEPSGRQMAETPPLVVLALESTLAPAVRPVPRVPPLPLPVPVAAPLPPVQEHLNQTAPGSDAASIDTVRGQVLLQRGLEAQESGDLKRALTLLEQAVKLDPTAKAAYNSLGNVHFQQKRFQQAVSMYHKALAIDPDYAKARNNLGSAYIQLAMYDKAIEELQHAVRTDGSASLAYYNLACVYARNSDSTTAGRYLQQAIALEPQARIWARTDADFVPVRNTPEIRQLLEP